jgi:aspartyl-tRNA(Asn)/glutamyl-tRNA(Gln) amidotransferase subunit B
LPDEMRERVVRSIGLSPYVASLLTASRGVAEFFEALTEHCGPQLAANWVTGELAGALNRSGLDIGESPVSAAQLGGLLRRIEDGTISGKIAKQVFEAMWNGEGEADAIIEAKGLKQLTDVSEIEWIVDEILAANPTQVEQYRNGKEKVFGFFVGQVMKATKGKANPQQVNALLKEKLEG